MDIDMKELEAFSCVVEKGSFSRAAEVLYLTQPTVSAHVASLERKLGVKLLVRTTKEIYPSDAGNLLYDYAREILRLRSGAVQAIHAFSKEMRGTITIAASTIPGQYYLPKLIQSFRSTYPDINFNLQILDSTEVAEQVSSRKAEIGFTGTVINLPKCIYHELTEDRLVIITPNTPKYQAYLSSGFPIRQITKESFINREAGSGTRLETEAFLKEMGVNLKDINTAVEVRSTESIKQMVSEGLGIAVISKSACEDYCQFKKILAFNFDSINLRRKLYLVRHKNSILAPITQTFYDYVAETYQTQLTKR
ncbi:MAG: LysR family transcriptional regulator [Oscillospiraceae bacterium]|nr:LysR family transcriptional regulator [Oscillospiraceae bacterium]